MLNYLNHLESLGLESFSLDFVQLPDNSFDFSNLELISSKKDIEKHLGEIRLNELKEKMSKLLQERAHNSIVGSISCVVLSEYRKLNVNYRASLDIAL